MGGVYVGVSERGRERYKETQGGRWTSGRERGIARGPEDRWADPASDFDLRVAYRPALAHLQVIFLTRIPCRLGGTRGREGGSFRHRANIVLHEDSTLPKGNGIDFEGKSAILRLLKAVNTAKDFSFVHVDAAVFLGLTGLPVSSSQPILSGDWSVSRRNEANGSNCQVAEGGALRERLFVRARRLI